MPTLFRSIRRSLRLPLLALVLGLAIPAPLSASTGEEDPAEELKRLKKDAKRLRGEIKRHKEKLSKHRKTVRDTLGPKARSGTGIYSARGNAGKLEVSYSSKHGGKTVKGNIKGRGDAGSTTRATVSASRK